VEQGVRLVCTRPVRGWRGRSQVRRMWASEASKVPILEFNYDKIIAGLGVTPDQFIDICILAGCDYCEPIKGASCWSGGGGGGGAPRAGTPCDMRLPVPDAQASLRRLR
jgi:hypothetical protein